MKPLLFNQEKGFTLTEILVSLAITSVITLMIGFFMTRQSRQADFLRYRLNMQTIYTKVEKSVTSPSILSNSALYNNSELFNCLNKDSVDPCTTTNPESQVGLFLYNFPKTVLTEIQESEAEDINFSDLEKYLITGNYDNPALYDLKTGVLCTSEHEKRHNCQYEVRAFFWATCPSNDSYLDEKDVGRSPDLGKAVHGRFSISDIALPQECDQAQSVHLRFQVKHNATLGPAIPFRIASMPKDSVFGDYETSSVHSSFGAVTTVVKKLPPITMRSFTCENNEYLIKITKGSPTCVCLYPFQKQIDGSCQIATGERCPMGQRYRGNDATAGAMVCQDVYCENVEMSKGCGKGGWIEGIKNNFWADYEALNYGPQLNSCGVMTDICDIREPNDSCNVDILCNQTVKCCYETEPERTVVRDGDDPYFGKLKDGSRVEALIAEHDSFLKGEQGGYEGTICVSDANCDATYYDSQYDITYSLLCCPSGTDTSEKRCRRGVYSATHDYKTKALVCPTRCHEEMDPNTMDPNDFNWAKDYCATLRTVERDSTLQVEKDAPGFIDPDDPQEYQCQSYMDPFLKISHEECRGWGYKWGVDSTLAEETQYVGCCDNKCISNFNGFEDEADDANFDKVCSFEDNCPYDYNPHQSDLDWDGLGDVCDQCPEDENLEEYVGSCGCVECPYLESLNDVETNISNITPAQVDATCDNYLCYNDKFRLYHYVPTTSTTMTTAQASWLQFYATKTSPPSGQTSAFMGNHFYAIVDRSIIEFCNPDITSVGSFFDAAVRTIRCALYQGILDRMTEDFGDFAFVRIKNRDGNEVFDTNEIKNEKNIKSVREEMVIDSGDALYFVPYELCKNGADIGQGEKIKVCFMGSTVDLSRYGSDRKRLLATDTSSQQRGFIISVLPTGTEGDAFVPGVTDTIVAGSSVNHLRLGDPPTGLGVWNETACAGPFALKSSINSSIERKGDNYGKYDKEELWVHHGSNVDLSDADQGLLGHEATFGSGTNPVNELFLDTFHEESGDGSYKLWACKDFSG